MLRDVLCLSCEIGLEYRHKKQGTKLVIGMDRASIRRCKGTRMSFKSSKTYEETKKSIEVQEEDKEKRVNEIGVGK